MKEYIGWKYRAAFILAVVTWLLMLLYVLEAPAKPDAPGAVIPAAKTHKELVREAALSMADLNKPAAEPEAVTYYEPPWPFYTDTELDQLALVIYQEAGGDDCSDETRQMVGEVVLNRVKDDRFSDWLHEILLQEGQYGRLHWTGLVWPARAELPEEEHAVRRAFACAEMLLQGEAVQLLPGDTVWQSEVEQGVETVVYQDGFYFCR